jgi:aminoglycoside phosphotransferase family enzyme/predicted kinase
MLQTMNAMKQETLPARPSGRGLVAALRSRFAARGIATQVIETHISWVVLAGRHAFKIKKAVNFGFLDFSTLDGRQRYCEEEVRLNQRLAPHLYLGVQALRMGRHGVALAGSGSVVEYAVRMRRMPADGLARDRLAHGVLMDEDLRRLAHRLAQFHEAAPRTVLTSDWGTEATILDDARRAVAGLESLADPEPCALLRAWFEEQAEGLAAVWRARRAQGYVREGHGDLHLGNVLVMGNEVTAFDCIEFDPALRWIDVMNDVGFLVMDLQAHGRIDLAYGFLDAYLEESGDFSGLRVLRFYMVYRAVVRALVTFLSERNSGPASSVRARDYMALALQLIQKPTPRVLITHGLPGSGKTWVTGALLRRVGAIRLRSDVERKRRAGLAPCVHSQAMGALYRPNESAATYRRLMEVAALVLGAGWSVIIDAAFLKRAQRDDVRQLALAFDVPFAILDCEASMASLHQRVLQRCQQGGDASDADERVLDQLVLEREPLSDAEWDDVLVLDTGHPYDIDAVLAAWQVLVAASRSN